jgi:hypothetical protein
MCTDGKRITTNLTYGNKKRALSPVVIEQRILELQPKGSTFNTYHWNRPYAAQCNRNYSKWEHSSTSDSIAKVCFQSSTTVGTNLCVPRPLEVKYKWIRGVAGKEACTVRTKKNIISQRQYFLVSCLSSYVGNVFDSHSLFHLPAS